MDDLQVIAAALAKPEPDREAVAEGRHRLQNAVRGGGTARSRRRFAWPAIGLSLTAAAAVTVVAVGTGTPSAPAPNSPPAAMSARQVLLAAADTAERTPEGRGAYWYVRKVEKGGPRSAPVLAERWTDRRGRAWRRDLKTEGKMYKVLGRPRLSLGSLEVTYEQVRRLPGEPDALRDWISAAVARSDIRTSRGGLTAADRGEFTLTSLISMVSSAPVTPRARAAAFRALAAWPGVTDLGRVPGGQGLRIPLAGGEARVVVDPATGLLRDSNFSVMPDGGLVWMNDGGTVTVTARWTDALPE
ncbi:CU044_5270 family protein [Actinomadura kijaniata]|uniref:CU044_5270 family protein n=1 Tax=Actinomadura namibiensis TaxID=182080 RepID=A0A7W3LLA6_ACTNM|nr:CU044_5270 family protein [Actinomadura namibiensis]MBA8950145.1 hypothetical protein [Actinomadura namibiensis]